MTATSSLVPRAQDQAWRRLLAMSRALPQGLALIGPPGVGKRRAARALYQVLNCANAGAAEQPEASLFGSPSESDGASPDSGAPDAPCGACTTCRKIAEGRHADLFELTPRGDTIAVDDLREMKKALNFPPLESKLRFVIIDEADKLNTSSANALLKTLEEPPAHTRFFLITHERGLLPATVASRCQFLYFSPLDDETLESLLKENGLEFPDSLRKIGLALMAGGMARAPMLTEEKTLTFLEAAQKHLSRHLAGPAGRDGGSESDWTEAVKLAETLTPQADSGEWKTELLLDLVVLLARRDALASRSAAETLRFTRRALEAAFLRRRLDRNANRKLIGLAAADLATRAPR